MHRRRGVVAVLTTLAALGLALVNAGSAGAYDFPSTNDQNRAAGLPHVDLVSTGPGTVTLSFINPKRTNAAFEYRIDGVDVGTETHPVVIGDVIHPNYCSDARNPAPNGCGSSPVIVTFHANATVEVRLALGGERDWDFDWVTFAVGPKLACGTPGTDRFSIGDASVVEGDSGKARDLRIPVTISNPAASAISVEYTITAGTAISPDDFTNKVDQPKRLTFKPGSSGVMATTKFITIKVEPDTAIEGDEDLTVTLANPTGGYAVGRDVGTATIVDDDGDDASQVVSISGSSACEGDTSLRGNKLPYRVTLRNPAPGDTTVTVAVGGGTATSGVDYKAVAKPKTVTFKAGQTTRSVTLSVLPDLLVESDEDVQATITDAPVPVLSGGAHSAILDDDDGGTSNPPI